VWTRDPSAAAAFTIDTFQRDPAICVRFWQTYVDHPAWRAEPNAAHLALARLDHAGVAVRVLTQNIDGLPQRAGLADRKVVEPHGTMRSTSCARCRITLPTNDVRERVRAGDIDPHCTVCGSVLKLDTVLFGERLDPSRLGQATCAGSPSWIRRVSRCGSAGCVALVPGRVPR
jgi:NAD-dependent deacetylase